MNGKCPRLPQHTKRMELSLIMLSQRIDIRFARQNEGQYVFRRIDFDAH